MKPRSIWEMTAYQPPERRCLMPGAARYSPLPPAGPDLPPVHTAPTGMHPWKPLQFMRHRGQEGSLQDLQQLHSPHIHSSAPATIMSWPLVALSLIR